MPTMNESTTVRSFIDYVMERAVLDGGSTIDPDFVLLTTFS